MQNPARIIACLLGTLAVSLPVFAQIDTFSARVVGVTDGDTITVLRESREIKIRLYGIDTPEKSQDYGSRAKQRTSDLVFGKPVVVEAVDTDRYGRTVANIFLPGGQSLNATLVSDGLAWWYQRYAPGDNVLEVAERNARSARRGLWSQPNPVAPWDFRRGETQTLSNDSVQQFVEEQRSTAPVPSEQALITVYSTRTGSKYHRDGCQYLRSSKISVSLKAATSSGLGPCSRCRPPTR